MAGSASQLGSSVLLATVLAILVCQDVLASPPRPLYQTMPVVRRDPPPGQDGPLPYILLNETTGAAPAGSVAESASRFDARTAAAIRYTVNDRDERLRNSAGVKTGHDNEQDFGYAILAMMAYSDYFTGGDFRNEAMALVMSELPGNVGTSIDRFGLNWHGEYDVLLQSYIALYYKYYDVLTADVRGKLLYELLSIRGRHPGLTDGIYPFINVIVLIPETENHELMIETARYLTNQLLHQEEVANASAAGRAPDHSQFDNNRNGDGNEKRPLVDYILLKLQDILKNDFLEYNSRPYQDYSLLAILNLASYAYDDRVKLAARMVLDYVSAKMAVSSHDLRRSVPYRRLNEESKYGPLVFDGSFLSAHLNTPLAESRDPLTAFYALLAGNTKLYSDGKLPIDFSIAMVNAGLRDYRVPPSILDLFVNPAHRRFYQRFHHTARTVGGDTGQFADELYAGSPNYLISAGGNPTYYSSVVHVPVVGGEGIAKDLGVAVPTSFLPNMPVGKGLWLGEFVQYGQYGTDITTVRNMAVAPDFACGPTTYIPPDISAAVSIRPPNSHWTFVDRSVDSGCYLAFYHYDQQSSEGFMEAFDTALHPGVTFAHFVYGGNGLTGVWSRYFDAEFVKGGQNTYITQSGQQITFTNSEIISTSAVPGSEVSTHWKQKFAHGTVLNSEQGSGYIRISNPDPASGSIILDMREQSLNGDPIYGTHHPRRTDEQGVVESAGAREEVWVDFKYTGPGNAGDFGDPFKVLGAALNAVAVGGTVNIVPGSTFETIRFLDKSMTLKSYPNSVTIGQ